MTHGAWHTGMRIRWHGSGTVPLMRWWRQAAFVILFAMFVHQPPVALSLTSMMQAQTQGLIATVTDRCPARTIVSIEQCADITVVLDRAALVAVVLVLLACLGAVFVAAVRNRLSTDWWWPPDRWRAFLQVFRC